MQCMHCACMLRLDMFVHKYMTFNKCMTNTLTSFKIMTKFSKTGFQGGGWFIPFIVIPTWQKITSFYLHKHGQVLSKTCFQGVVPPDLPPEGSRSGVLVRINQKTYFQGLPAPRNRFLVIPSHFKNMIRICQKPVFRGWYTLIYPLQEVNKRVLPP